jgi:hypothetical protein
VLTDIANELDDQMSIVAPVLRWREAFQHDFAARMDWTVKDREQANHNPIVVVNGQAGKAPRGDPAGAAGLRLRVEDNGAPSLTSYRRIIFRIRNP